MELTRRGFLKVSGLATIALVISPVSGKLWPMKLSQAATEANVTSRWAMAVKTGACPDGCKECIDACHRIHNVPDFGNPKDEIKWIWDVPFEAACPDHEHEFLKEDLKRLPVVVLCNHCDNPPCVKVCPTKATFKREDGIVMMDYHRCIGCRYCMAACPYGSRSFNWRDPRPFIKDTDLDYPTRTRGVVEKCNFCEERLAQGLVPACVEACPEKALVFGDLEDPESEIRALLRASYSIQRKPSLGSKPQIYYIV
ncbi:sulfate reduction electron transfer complex DsrMKJOP subunit DsrO [Chloroflexota bacterium]